MKTSIFALMVVLLVFISGCNSGSSEYQRHNRSFLDTFDTMVQVVAYTKSENEFSQYADLVHSRLQYLHKLYDIYNTYEGLNNIKTINDNAGIKPVEVEQEIIDLILFAKDWSEHSNGAVNIALGPVLQIWHDYREEAHYDPGKAELPPLEKLKAAAEHTNLNRGEVNPEEMTVYLPDPEMSLDVGAVAKGFALEIVAREVSDAGMSSGIISAGGNIRAVGDPEESERDHWKIGVQDPEASIVGNTDRHLDVIYLSKGSVDTSGDYQRYYKINDELIHHLIDPQTLMPASHYRSVTVVAADSGVSDFMSTSLFLIPYEESLAMAENHEELEALWVMPDGEVRTTPGMEQMLQSYGKSSENNQHLQYN